MILSRLWEGRAITIATEPAPLSYDGDDATTTFAITWKYFAKSDVVATLRDTSDVETVWVLDTDYSLTAAGVDAGGTLTALLGAPATGETLVITLEPPNTQTSSLPLGGPFPSPSVEDGLDLAAQRDSKINSLLDRGFRVPVTDTQTGSNLELPIDSDRASKFMAFDGNGKPIAAAGTSADLTPVSTYINTLLDDADAAAARATLLWVKGADIASAATLVLGSDGIFFNVTGNTGPITTITVPIGTLFMLQMNSTPKFTYHATNLNLPGGADITAVAGDRLIGFATAANQVFVLTYTRIALPVGLIENRVFN